MSRSLRRGATAALVLAAIVPLSACATGTTPATLQVRPNSVATSIGNNLKLNAITVVTAGDATSDTAGPITVSLSISNTGPDAQTLKSLTVGGTAATFANAKGGTIQEIVVPAGGAVSIGGPGNPTAGVTSAKVNIGGFAPTSFTFANAGTVSVDAAVRPAAGEYASFGPSGVSASPSPSSSASASTSASASPSPSASATVSPSAPASPSSSATASASPSH